MATPQPCDACKHRKIRCDREDPCSSCRTTGAACRRDEDRIPRSRVVVSKEYERKIDLIGDRLSSIEACLSYATPPSSTPASRGGSRSTPALGSSGISSVSKHPRISTGDASPIEEAFDATTSTHAFRASKAVDQALKQDSIIDRHPALASALDSLKDMVSKINETPQTEDRDTTLWEKMGNSFPSSSRAEIFDILARADGSLLFMYFPALTSELLIQRCEEVFDRPRDCSPVRRVLVFGVIFELCIAYSEDEKNPSLADRFSGLARKFIPLLKAAISGLPLIIQPSMEAVIATTIAAMAAVELCKPHLATSLTSIAASMVLSLGYNRLSSMQSESDQQQQQQKIYLFWTVYVLDASFSTRLGRLPVIREYDISVPTISSNGIVPDSFAEMLRHWIDLCRVQCHAAEHLYSPASTHQPPDERSALIKRLTTRLEEIWRAREERASLMHELRSSPASYVSLIEASESILHYSTLALVQHAANPSSSSHGERPPEAALKTARHALWLSTHFARAIARLSANIQSAHCHWTLLHAPFTPFTMTFNYIIAHPARSIKDLSLLADFTAALGTLSHVSESVAKLHRICDVLQKVADLYVKAKAQEVAHGGTTAQKTSGGAAAVNVSTSQPGPPVQSTIRNIDGCLSAIGIVPPAVTQNPDGTPARDNNNNNNNNRQPDDARYLHDWFQGNGSLMGLLEHDLLSQREGLDEESGMDDLWP